jgi:hypothetical protein
MTYLKRVPLVLAALAAIGLTACSSSASTPQATASNAADTVSATCQRVSATLSDGPDPDADPVGYAESQFGPLRVISTHDTALGAAIGKLADAYQEFFTSNGSSAAKEAVTVASNAVNKICPGATS